jgi:hypothetical protein
MPMFASASTAEDEKFAICDASYQADNAQRNIFADSIVKPQHDGGFQWQQQHGSGPARRSARRARGK